MFHCKCSIFYQKRKNVSFFLSTMSTIFTTICISNSSSQVTAVLVFLQTVPHLQALVQESNNRTQVHCRFAQQFPSWLQPQNTICKHVAENWSCTINWGLKIPLPRRQPHFSGFWSVGHGSKAFISMFGNPPASRGDLMNLELVVVNQNSSLSFISTLFVHSIWTLDGKERWLTPEDRALPGN